MRNRLIGLIGAMVMFWCGSAMALDQSGCDHWFWNDGMQTEWQCDGMLELSDMGDLAPDGTFTPTQMWADVLEWDMSDSVYEPFNNWIIPDGSLQVRNYSDRPGLTRLATNIGTEVLGPTLWKATCISGAVDPQCEEGVPCPCPDGQESFFMDFDGEINGPRQRQLSFEMMDSSRITVTWEDKGLVADGYIQTYDAVFPKYELYPMNFWNYNKPWTYGADMIFQFPEGVVPEAGINNMTITIDGVVSYQKTYNVTTTDPMPTVSATKEVEDHLKMTIQGKEIKSGLKITWNDPPFKQIQKPGIQLRVYVGNSNNGTEAGNLGGHEIFYWIDCPAQMHKLLIPTEYWTPLKEQLIAAGYTEALVLIVYRTIEGGYDAPEEGQFMNRGHSDILKIDLGIL